MGNANGIGRGERTRRLAVSAMLSALGVVIMYIGSPIEVMDISLAVIASLFCVLAVVEYGGAYPWMIFAVTAVLSVWLLPNKTPGAMYAVFFGFYPILKEKFEGRGRILSWVLKELVFNIGLAAMLLLFKFVFMVGEVNIGPVYIVAVVVMAELVFILYDIALTRLISLYIYRLRKRFRIK